MSDSEDEGGSVKKRPKITDSDHEGEEEEDKTEKEATSDQEGEKKDETQKLVDSSEDEGVAAG